jgi:hypothetical protein
MPVNWSLDDREVVATGGDGSLLWRGRVLGRLAVQVEGIPGQSDALVILDWAGRTPGAFGNLLRLRPDGTPAWVAALPWEGDDFFTEFRLSDGVIHAWTWSCFRVSVDLETGRLGEPVFVK